MKIYVDINKTLGKILYMVGADDWFEFHDGKRTDNLLGARVNIVLPLNKFARVNVKLPNKKSSDLQKTVDDTDGGFVQVRLIEPEAIVYMFNGKQGISVTAEDVEFVK